MNHGIQRGCELQLGIIWNVNTVVIEQATGLHLEWVIARSSNTTKEFCLVLRVDLGGLQQVGDQCTGASCGDLIQAAGAALKMEQSNNSALDWVQRVRWEFNLIEAIAAPVDSNSELC